MAKNRPLLINLATLLFTTVVVTLVYLSLGPGIWLQVTVSLLFTLPWTVQFLLLAVAANAHRPPSPYTSKLTFTLWAAVGYIFVGLMAPPGMFPEWFIPVSALIGFLMWYPMISLFLWMVSRLRRWRLPWAKTE